jgi:hypothetical protein
MPSRPARSAPLLVTIVAKNASTLRGLETYLRGAGVLATTTAAIERVVDMTPPAAAAVILFPDEFAPQAAADALATLKGRRPDVLVVIVTNEPQRFDERDEDDALRSLIMAKPAWAWTILDAVRARLDRRPARSRGSAARRTGPP